MSERLGFKNQLSSLRSRLMGRSALNDIANHSPLLDQELRIAYRGSQTDPVTGQNLNPEYTTPWVETTSVFRGDEQDFLDNGWELDDQDAESEDYLLTRAVPAPIIVDEYGIETCYEPTVQQIEALASEIGGSSLLLEQQIDMNNYFLAREGALAINYAELKDEQAIKMLFEDDDKDLDAGSRLRRSVYLTNHARYNAGADTRVLIDDKDEYLSQQKIINRTMNSAEAMT